MKHQLDATLCRFYFCRVTLHVSGANAHHQEYLKLVQRPLVHVLSLQVSHHISLFGPELNAEYIYTHTGAGGKTSLNEASASRTDRYLYNKNTQKDQTHALSSVPTHDTNNQPVAVTHLRPNGLRDHLPIRYPSTISPSDTIYYKRLKCR